jgi:hypothetical protein
MNVLIDISSWVKGFTGLVRMGRLEFSGAFLMHNDYFCGRIVSMVETFFSNLLNNSNIMYTLHTQIKQLRVSDCTNDNIHSFALRNYPLSIINCQLFIRRFAQSSINLHTNMKLNKLIMDNEQLIIRLAQEYGLALLLAITGKRKSCSSVNQINQSSGQKEATHKGISEPSDRLPATLEGISEPSDRLPATLEGISEPSNRLPATLEGISEPSDRLPATLEGISEPSGSLPAMLKGINEPSCLFTTTFTNRNVHKKSCDGTLLTDALAYGQISRNIS